MINITVIGRIGKDAEIVETKNGNKLIRFSLASDVRANGKEETAWFDVSYKIDKPENLVQYLTKGRLLCVQGIELVSAYIDKNQQPRVDRAIWANSLDFISTGKQENATTSTEATATIEVKTPEVKVPVATPKFATIPSNEAIDDLPF